MQEGPGRYYTSPCTRQPRRPSVARSFHPLNSPSTFAVSPPRSLRSEYRRGRGCLGNRNEAYTRMGRPRERGSRQGGRPGGLLEEPPTWIQRRVFAKRKRLSVFSSRSRTRMVSVVLALRRARGGAPVRVRRVASRLAGGGEGGSNERLLENSCMSRRRLRPERGCPAPLELCSVSAPCFAFPVRWG
jgi:hypothetical protein